ncbi:MAG: response regulator transcription factor [Caldilineaceae bacterium]
MSYKIFIVEDHTVMQQMLQIFISRMADFEVCGAALSANQALEELPAAAPDLVLIDMSLPRSNGAALMRSIRAQWPDLPCVFYSGHGEAIYVEQALRAGANGYILKGEPSELEPALQRIMAGESYLSESLHLREQ